MESKITYTKLSALVGQQFTIIKAGGYTWKKWDPTSGRMLTSEKWEDGFKKTYTIDTDKGRLDIGPGQLGTLLEATYKQGVADITNKEFALKSNGKTGIDIRYFFNLVPAGKKLDPVYDVNENEQVSLEDIPF